jgi:hypothetical protein
MKSAEIFGGTGWTKTGITGSEGGEKREKSMKGIVPELTD